MPRVGFAHSDAHNFYVALREAIEQLVTARYPGARVISMRRLGAGEQDQGSLTEKGFGYGEPLLIEIRNGQSVKRLVFHTAAANEFGHDRRSDRAQEVLLAYDTFSDVDRHVVPVDVGAVAADGTLRSLRDCGEFYVLTEYGEGHEYADDLRRISEGRVVGADVEVCRNLAMYLARLHDKRVNAPATYRRAIRDMIGHGEGIYGIVDGYPDDVEGAPVELLKEIEERAAEWRWILRRRTYRLCVTHGDFHPFNIVIDAEGLPVLLDASRGCRGDPADDVACLAINYPFFALGTGGQWEQGTRVLWYTLWQTYMAETGDHRLPTVVPPFLAWRALVLANPIWYPNLPAEAREKLLGWVRRVLERGRLEPCAVEELF